MSGSSKATSFTLITILALVWGSSFILMKRGLDSFTPLEIGTIRIFASFLCMTPFLIKSLGKVPKEKWKYLAASGWLGNGIPAVLFPLAETHLSSALTGMLNSLTPLFTFIVGISIFRMTITQNRLLGLIIGLSGALLLVGFKSTTGSESNLLYAFTVVAATICYGFSVNIIRSKLAEVDPITITSIALLFTGIPMGITLCFTGVIHKTIHMPGAVTSLFYVVLLGALSTALSTVLFTKLVKMSGALFAASVTYLIPIVAVLWGVADGETLSPVHFLGLAGALIGVYLINKSNSPKSVRITSGGK